MNTYASWEVSQAHARLWMAQTDIGTRVVLRQGKTIYEELIAHRYFYLIRSGYVQVTISRPNGSALLLEIYGPGTIFGEGSAFEGTPRPVTTTTVTDCALERYDPGELGEAFSRNPELPMSLIRLMSAKQRILASKVAGLSSSTPELRLCDLLLRVGHAEHLQRLQAPTLQVHLTHEQLASMSGLARVTVTRTLAKLSKHGLIRTQPACVEVLNPDQLRARLRG
ncbi:Crp/Fnr family transcriptional regulator [Hydrogenophaga sp.]|jgi:CRP/FNR family cyclic AMP-dependent transcriptional regulator|uniref:Crp/Fnr family transcriptional regulator n=1 Tax=Hydrogenophaga sp. TaxID=1904254 RepID=UPI003F6F23F6